MQNLHEIAGADEERGEVAAMLTGLVAAGALALLLVIAVCIGASLDTEVQRRERQRLAEERRLRCDARRADRTRPGSLCDRCPYRD